MWNEGGKGGEAERGGGRLGWRRPVAQHWLRAGRLMAGGCGKDVCLPQKRHVTLSNDFRNNGYLPPLLNFAPSAGQG